MPQFIHNSTVSKQDARRGWREVHSEPPPTQQFADKRPEDTAIRQLQGVMRNSPLHQEQQLMQRVMQQQRVAKKTSMMPIQRQGYGEINTTEGPVEPKLRGINRFRAAVRTVQKGLSGRLVFMEEASRRRDQEQGVVRLDKRQLTKHQAQIDHDNHLLTRRGDGGHTVPLDTSGHHSHEKEGFAAFVMDELGRLLLFNHKDGTDKVKHSTFSEDKPVIGAGELRIVNGQLTHMTTHSGHYKPRAEDIANVLRALREQGLNVDDVKVLMSKDVFAAAGAGLRQKGQAPEAIPNTSHYVEPEEKAKIELSAREQAEDAVEDEKYERRRTKAAPLSAEEERAIYEREYAYIMRIMTGREVHTMFDQQVRGADIMSLPVRKPSAERLRSQDMEPSLPRLPSPPRGPVLPPVPAGGESDLEGGEMSPEELEALLSRI